MKIIKVMSRKLSNGGSYDKYIINLERELAETSGLINVELKGKVQGNKIILEKKDAI